MRSRIAVLLVLCGLVLLPFTGKAQGNAARAGKTPAEKVAKLRFAVDGQDIGDVTNERLVVSELANLTRLKNPTKKSPRVGNGLTVAVASTKAGFLKQWFDDVEAKKPSVRRTATLTGLDSTGTSVIVWTFTSAWPVKYIEKQKASKALVETIALRFEQFDRTK